MITVIALVGGFVAGFVVSFLVFRKNKNLAGKAEDAVVKVADKIDKK